MDIARCLILFRVDGGHIPGVSFGHVFRCLGLAEEFKRHDINPVFVMKGYYEGVEVVKKRGFHVLTIPPETDIVEDCTFTRNVVEDSQIQTIIFDLPGIQQTHLQFLPRHVRTIVVDDIGGKEIQPDIIVNGSVVRTFRTYPEFPSTIRLLGGEYSILGHHFDNLPIRKIREKVKTVSLFFGGSDPENLTERVVKSLNRFQYPFTLQVIIGPGYKHLTRLSRQIENAQNRMVFLNTVNNMARCFLQSDIAITAGGMTLYELAATGTPAIVIPSIAHEVHTANALQQLHSVKNLGMWTENHPEILPETLYALARNYELRQQMSQAGQMTIDGKGRNRVITRILSHLTTIQPSLYVS